MGETMLIQCTKTLLDKLKIKGNELASPEGHAELPESFMAWHANFVSIGRKKAIILMNNETRYPVVIYRPSTKDFSNIKVLIREAIKEVFRMEGVSKKVTDSYLERAGEITFSKTANRSLVSKLNNTVREVESMQDYLDEDVRIQRFISIFAGRLIQLSGTEPAFYPYERLLEHLGTFNDRGNIVDVDLYQLKIKIQLVGHDIWRRVLVPSTFSFQHLHNIIQTVFDWQNYHLHEFEVDRGENKPLKILMDDYPNTMEYIDPEVVDFCQERFVALEDIFPTYQEVIYEYDFGDSWIHLITIEKVIKSHLFQAIYIEGKGERPPEDVGGEGGFEEYLRIMENPQDPGYEDMKAWAEGQREREQGEIIMNQRLKKVISGYGYTSLAGWKF
jgi:hypothetical protein